MSVSRIIPPLLAVIGFVTTSALAAPVNINSADAATLSRELKGIGQTKAEAIVEYRQKHGAFRTVDELALVKGVGQKLVDLNRAELRVSGAAVATASAAAAAPKTAGTATRPATAAPPRR